MENPHQGKVALDRLDRADQQWWCRRCGGRYWTSWVALRVDGDIIVVVVGGVVAITAEVDAAVVVRPEVAAATQLHVAVDAYFIRGIAARTNLGRERIRLIGIESGRPRAEQHPVDVVEEQLPG